MRGEYRAAMLATHLPAPPKPIRLSGEMRRMKRRCILRELASLGLTIAESARLLGIDGGVVQFDAARFDIPFIRYRQRETPLRAAVREAYAPGGIGPTAMARKLGKDPKVLMVIGCQMGLSQSSADRHRFSRGFDIPSEKANDYRVLMKYRYKMHEAGRILGLLPAD